MPPTTFVKVWGLRNRRTLVVKMPTSSFASSWSDRASASAASEAWQESSGLAEGSTSNF